MGIRVYPLFDTAIWSIQMLYGLAVVFLVISPILFFAFRKRLSVPKAAILYKVGTGWLMLITYSFLLTLLSDLLLVIMGDFVERTTRTLIRLDQLQAWFIVLGTLGIAWIGNINYYRKKVVQLDLKTEKSLNQPVKMVVLSDLHLGHAISRKELKRWVEFINQQQADVVLFAGDKILTKIAFYSPLKKALFFNVLLSCFYAPILK